MSVDNRALFAAAQYELETRSEPFSRAVLHILKAFRDMAKLEGSSFTYGKIERRKIEPHEAYYKEVIYIRTSVGRLVLTEWSETGREPSANIYFGPREFGYKTFHDQDQVLEGTSFASSVIRGMYRMANDEKQIPPTDYRVLPSSNTHSIWRDLHN